MSEPLERRRALAVSLGVDAVVVPGEEALSAVLEMTNGLGADLVFNGVSSQASSTAPRICAVPARRSRWAVPRGVP
ncbi:hypothetical protein PV728_36285 [Streptomyces europaeiscabiei]|nr:hypothetical protein [Streptomyces europaeiscabiei]MDX3653853.1 hypothetical protein [Streptomyces europaeiscabiei]